MRCVSVVLYSPSPIPSHFPPWQCAGDTEVSNDNNDDGGVNVDALFADRPRDSPLSLHIFAMSSSKLPIHTIDGCVNASIGGRGAGARS